jgi:hypothetical protein
VLTVVLDEWMDEEEVGTDDRGRGTAMGEKVAGFRQHPRTEQYGIGTTGDDALNGGDRVFGSCRYAKGNSVIDRGDE